MGNGDCPTGFHADFAEQPHTLVGRTWVPVGKADIGLTRLGSKHLHSQHVLLLNVRRNVEGELTERACHFLGIRYLVAVEPDIGTIAETIKRKNGCC